MAAACDHTLPLQAGPERSVAATKTFVTSVLAALALVAEWREDDGLRAAVAALPGQFEQALACDWTPLADRLVRASSAFVLGRGPGFAIANEVALKFKETCAIHAESYSAAEVLHGPAAIVQAHFPVLALAVDDAALPQVVATAERLAGQGADVFLTAPRRAAGRWRCRRSPGVHPLTAPLVLVVVVLPLRRGAGAAARLQPRHAAAPAQGDGDGVSGRAARGRGDRAAARASAWSVRNGKSAGSR